VRSERLYAVRRDHHSLVIGATVEDAGFETCITPDGQLMLLDFCHRLFPGLGKRPIRASWAGLRPATADGLPVVGQLDDGPIWYATGHYRNGILLAPWTAATVASWMAGEEPEQRFVDAFSPGRFNQRESRQEPGLPAPPAPV
jgi:glycine/D-amino acid oxidase-like deaminating enzyme